MMHVTPRIGAAAIAMGIAVTGLATGTVPANAFPLAPPCTDQNQAACQTTPGGGNAQGGNGQSGKGQSGNGQGGNGQGGNASQAPQSSTSPTTQSQAPQSPRSGNDAPQTTQGQAPQNPRSGSNDAPQTTQGQAPQNPQGSDNGAPRNPQSGGPDTPQSSQGNAPQGGDREGSSNGAQTGTPVPSRNEQARQPFRPAGALDRGNDQVGGPRDAPHGFSTPDNGAPPPPPEKGNGWNDGPAPGQAPANWDGPPPAGGWNGPPPPGGWNRSYDGPTRDVSQARNDFGRFNYNDYTAIPVFNPSFGGWGFWFFGVWIPLF